MSEAVLCCGEIFRGDRAALAECFATLIVGSSAFEITAVGHANAGLEQRVPAVIAGLDLNVVAGSERVRPSSNGNFVSVSVTFTCPSREMYEAAHAALRADPAVKWTL